ncbi:MAG TPA: beta-galactosidase [Puia sp.]|nr:beta-galactosidase [Puia sp.]
MKKWRLFFAAICIHYFPVFSQEKLISREQIPIMAWYSIPASETSVPRFEEMKGAGITYQLNGYPNLGEMIKALDIAAKTGIKLVVSCPELKSDPEGTVKRLMNYPAVAGYHLMDEPSITQLADLAAWAKRIQSIDHNHFCYVNLFPDVVDSATLHTNDYRKYVNECATTVPLQFLSFDYYPVLKEKLAESWFDNLRVVADEAKKSGKTFWAFALTTNYDNAKVTPQTLASLRLQVYADLAYGAQGIEYFTYWSATSLNTPSSEDQRGALISARGKRTVVYDRVKQVSEEIKNLSGVFAGSKVVWVRHTGKDRIPSGTVRLTSLPEPVKVLETNGAPAIVSLLEKENNYFLVIVNKDYYNNMGLVFYGTDEVKKICKDGSIVPANAYENAMEVDPGDAVIYMFPKASVK